MQSNRNSNYHNSNCVVHFTKRDNWRYWSAKAMLIWRTLFWPLCVVIFYLQVSSPNSPTSNDRKKIQKKWLAGAKLWSGNDSPCPWWMQVQQQHTHCYVRHYHASRKKMVLPGRGVWNLFSAAQPQITCCCSHSSNCSRFLLPSARRRRIVCCFFVFFSYCFSFLENVPDGMK